MTKNFYAYVKELIPEKGSVFFTKDTHEVMNMLSLYQLADLLCGKNIKFCKEVTGYSWHVDALVPYDFPTMGLFVLKRENGASNNLIERWIHFSQHAFIGAICIVATRNNITFDNSEFERIRQIWQRKIENKEDEKDKIYTETLESNFSDNWFWAEMNARQQDPCFKDFLEDYEKAEKPIYPEI